MGTLTDLNPNDYVKLGAFDQYVDGVKVFNEIRLLGQANNSLRVTNVAQTYSTIFRTDANNFYFLLTNQNEPFGNFNNFRPLTINFQNGSISIETLFRLPNLPTSPIGLPVGTVWRDGVNLKVVV